MKGTFILFNFILSFKIKIKEVITSRGAINVDNLIVNANREKQQIIVKYLLIFIRSCSSDIFKK